ncbi:hypothetical protein ACQ1ZK_16525, partial [Enterococcus faecium]
SLLVAALVAGSVAVPAGVAYAHPGAGSEGSHASTGMARMHGLMQQGKPGMARMHEMMQQGNPGMSQMCELLHEGAPGRL